MFVAYEATLELIRALGPLLRRVAPLDRDLAQQIRRAASSVALNLSEGRGLSGPRQANHYRIASGSAQEVGAGLDLIEAWGLAPVEASTKQRLDRVRALLWGLTHR